MGHVSQGSFSAGVPVNGMCSSGVVLLAKCGNATSRLCGHNARAVCLLFPPTCRFCSQFNLAQLWPCILNICCEFVSGLLGRSVCQVVVQKPAVQPCVFGHRPLGTIPDRFGLLQDASHDSSAMQFAVLLPNRLSRRRGRAHPQLALGCREAYSYGRVVVALGTF